MPIKIFCCYAHEDEQLLNKLKAHLRPMQRQGLIVVWHDRDITAGTEWELEINQRLNEAEIILLLISPDFMDSDYCYGKEMKRAIERHERGEARVIPVILRSVYWQSTPFHKLQALPIDSNPVKSWLDEDVAFFNVAEGIREVVELLLLRMKDPHYVYIQATSEEPVLHDPLNSQSASDWLVGDWDDSSFFFSEGALHLTVKKKGIYAPSVAKATHFSDFAFQAEMTLITGDGGGIVFRSGIEAARGYRFLVGRDHAELFCDKKQLFSDKTLSLKDFSNMGGCAPSRTALDEAFLLTVVAKGSDIFLYVDRSFVTHVQDDTASSGRIGLMAVNFTHDTHVEFRNIQVWNLPKDVLHFF